ncbi:MAG: Arc family DNA-binding protein [Eubacteriales bacterium]|nr:Arc family DNA-binding protein [Eubacteriales bacterium]
MKRTEAVDRAIKKYEAEKVDRIVIRVPKGKKEKIADFAAQNGESTNGFINRVINEAMKK